VSDELVESMHERGNFVVQMERKIFGINIQISVNLQVIFFKNGWVFKTLAHAMVLIHSEWSKSFFVANVETVSQTNKSNRHAPLLEKY
jgi:hypothetical protein